MTKPLSCLMALLLLLSAGSPPFFAGACASETLQVTGLAVSPEPAVGASSTWTLSTSGGTGTKEYDFHVYWGGDLRDRTYMGTEELASRPWGPLDRFTYAPDREGVYFVHAFARDGSATRGIIERYVLMPPLTVLSVTADKTDALAGETLTWTTAVSGGTGYEIRCQYVLYRDDVPCAWSETMTGSWHETAFAWSHAPEEAGTYRVAVWVNAHTDLRIGYSGDTLVRPRLAILSVEPDRNHALPGGSVTWTISSVGGEGEVRHKFVLYRDGEVISETVTGADSSFRAEGLSAGVWQAEGEVADEVLKDWMMSGEVYVGTYVLLPLQIVGVFPDRTGAAVGDTVIWTALALGGSGERAFSWELYRNDILDYSRTGSSGNSFSFTFSEPGRYRLHATAADGTGRAEADSDELGVSTSTYGYASLPEFTIVTATPAPLTLPPVARATPRRTPGPAQPAATATLGPVHFITPAPVTFSPLPEPLRVKANAYPAEVSVKESVKVNAAAHGGTGSYEYHFTVYHEGVAGITRDYASSANFTFYPGKPGSYRVRVIVRDGETKASVYTGTVTAR